jgi:histone deacetylase 11
MLYATGGSILGARLAWARGWAINLGGGFHHASSDRGGGFCVYADITLAIRHLRMNVPEARKAVILDLDAHQGNGHERDALGDEDTHIVDFFNHSIYPYDLPAKKAIKCAVSVRMHTDEEYLEALREHLEASIASFAPSFLLYNAGTDCMVGDPLGGMRLTPDGIVRRDELVFGMCLAANLPILMVLSGGYQKSNAPVIARSITNLMKKFDLAHRARRPHAADGLCQECGARASFASDGKIPLHCGKHKVDGEENVVEAF